MDVAALRAMTPGCQDHTHLNNAGAALLSTETLTAMTDHLDREARSGGYEAAAAAEELVENTYTGLAELVGGDRNGIALFDNSTHAWNAAFYSIPLRPGDRILTDRNEYGSSVLAYLQVAQRTGAEVVVVPDDGTGQIDTDALAELIDERTRVIGLTWVPTSGGLVNPAAAVGRVARETDALYLLDATQVVGQLPIDVAELGCDMLTGTGRKFLRGPRGTGFLWVGDTALERLEPHVAEVESAIWDGAQSFTWAPGAQRFETWEKNYVDVIGLGSAVRQALDLGIPEIAERVCALGAGLRDRLDGIAGVRTHDLGVERCAIVTATMEGHAAADVAAALQKADIAVSTTVPEHNQLDSQRRAVHPLVRFSPHYFTTDDELDRCAEVVAGLVKGY